MHSPVTKCQSKTLQKKSSFQLVNLTPKRTYLIRVGSVCLLQHCLAKTTEQQGVMVIKETTPQLEDAAFTPPCWQASVRLFGDTVYPRDRSGEVCSFHQLGEDLHHSRTNFGEMSTSPKDYVLFCRIFGKQNQLLATFN